MSSFLTAHQHIIEQETVHDFCAIFVGLLHNLLQREHLQLEHAVHIHCLWFVCCIVFCHVLWIAYINCFLQQNAKHLHWGKMPTPWASCLSGGAGSPVCSITNMNNFCSNKRSRYCSHAAPLKSDLIVSNCCRVGNSLDYHCSDKRQIP